MNEFVVKNQVQSVVEFGCGDGRQLSLAAYPAYLGIDVSPSAVETCRRRFSADSQKKFMLTGSSDVGIHDLALSLDVIFHLTEDQIFHTYMNELFNASRRFVVIYSSNMDGPSTAVHVKHRAFTDWVEKNRFDWKLVSVVRNEYMFDPNEPDETSFSDFYFYEWVGKTTV